MSLLLDPHWNILNLSLKFLCRQSCLSVIHISKMGTFCWGVVPPPLFDPGGGIASLARLSEWWHIHGIPAPPSFLSSHYICTAPKPDWQACPWHSFPYSNCVIYYTVMMLYDTVTILYYTILYISTTMLYNCYAKYLLEVTVLFTPSSLVTDWWEGVCFCLPI